MHLSLLWLLLVIPAALCGRIPPISPQNCSNYYGSQSLPGPCDPLALVCTFSEGIRPLISNSSESEPFSLCLDLPEYSISINYKQANQTYIQEIQSVYIYAQNVLMNNDYTLFCTDNVVILARNALQMEQCFLTGARVWLYAGNSLLLQNSNFVNESVIQTGCSCVDQKGECDWQFSYPYLFEAGSGEFNISVFNEEFQYWDPPNNSITIVADNQVEIQASHIKYSIIGIFSQNVVLSNSQITSSGLGYPSDSGPGCGYFDQVLNQLLGCMGSGGSHGGFGGNSSPQNCYLLVSKQPYGNMSYPSEPGSGGGFFLPHSRQSSSGGGIINIQAELIVSNGSSLLAEGKNGIQGGGGGAGGSISLDYFSSVWNSTTVSTTGGNGDKQSSSGSGGRIRLWNRNWKHEAANTPTTSNFIVSVAGGSGCMASDALSCGQSGSVITSPCQPGYELTFPSYICHPCNQGFYQLTFGYTFCLPCSPKPDNSFWTNNYSASEPIYYYAACGYNCSQGYNNYNGRCLTETEHFFQRIYATDVIVSLGMIFAAVVIYFLIVVVKRLAQKERLLSFDDANMNETYKKKFFRLEDLPYHQMRIYCSGENHPFNPWKIKLEDTSFQAEIRPPLTKIHSLILKVVKEINTKAEYSRWQKILLVCLRYTYYPLSRFLLSSMRKTKAREIFEEVDKFNKKIPDFEELGMKFHVKPQLTVASLQLFNYNKSVLDFYIENYFPLHILLEKAPFGGYVIDFTDPFLKVFINQIIQKDITGKSVQNFLKQLNKYLKNQAQMLNCLNYLWTLSDSNPKFQAYLWQPPNKTLGIDRQYKIQRKEPLFLSISSENLSNGHFLLEENLPSLYLPEIECLKHKFTLCKDLASEEDGNTIWMIQNQVNQRVLLWVFGFLTVIFLLLTVSSFFLIVLMDKIKDCSNNSQTFDSFEYGIVVYFALWPLADFIASFLNFLTIFTRNEYVLANGITFTLTTIAKSLVLFICVLVYNLQTQKTCFQITMYVWLIMLVTGVFIFLIQIMLRARLIAQTK